MKNLLSKEIRLAASPLAWLFLVFGLMALIPRYPILVCAFFICFGVFQSFQSGRENNDILYTVLLPVRKTDTVKAKYAFTVLIQMLGFGIAAVATGVRMVLLGEATPYVTNPMMNANQAFLAYMLLIFALFNVVFMGGFFKTAYKFGKPFVMFIIVSFLVVGIGEVLHHIPGLTFLNAPAPLADPVMWGILGAAAAVYAVATLVSCKVAMKRFALVDM
ncbi:MAG: ABC-2 transporter permease [Clostridia bacterium]|nr:ABC-2 transporter permease [Clostridia bacterium]